MFNLTGSEIIFILLLALVVLGPEKLPGAIRRATRTYVELRKMGDNFQSEFKSVFDEPIKEMRETAQLIQQNADPKRIAEEAEREAAETARKAAAVPSATVESAAEVQADDDQWEIDEAAAEVANSADTDDAGDVGNDDEPGAGEVADPPSFEVSDESTSVSAAVDYLSVVDNDLNSDDESDTQGAATA